MAGDEIFVFYGSQTGQAETIADSIHESAEEHGIKSTLMCLWKAEEVLKVISDGSVPVVFVCSTTGDGELPGNARKFMRIIQRKTLPHDQLSKLRYALLGLGDTNYSTFCGGPKTLERGLKILGATRFYPTGFADDGTDLEIVVEPWLEGLWPALKSHIRKRKNFLEIPPERVSSDLEIGSILKDLDLTKVDDGANTTTTNGHTYDQTSIVCEGHLEVTNDSPISSLSKNSEGTLPPLMQSYITYDYVEPPPTEVELSPLPCVPYPIAENERFYYANVKSVVKLTAENAVKTAYCVTLKVPDDLFYEPGDSFGVYIQNPNQEVDWLIKRLMVESICDKPITLKIDPNTKKKNAKLPNYIAKVTTIRHVLKCCLEIRSVPKRTFLRALYECTTSENDRNILLQLCRKESMEQFSKFVREPNLTIIDLLAVLPTCHPPFATLVEHLPRLKARLYSAASCLDSTPNEVRFVFNLVDFEPGGGRMYARVGISTGYLATMADILTTNAADNAPPVPVPDLAIFITKNNSFRLPSTMDCPIVMVGPGTGVAPFMGFLEQMRGLRRKNIDSPESWLFCGCRHKERDFLFEEDLNMFVADGTLSHLVVAYSRDNSPQNGAVGITSVPKYVQDNLMLNSNAILDLILRKNAVFYVCGDARNMAKDVRAAIVDILSKGMTKDVAMETFKKLVKDGKYKEDVWT